MITPNVFIVGDGVAFSTETTPDFMDMDALKKKYGVVSPDKIGALRNIKLYDGKHVVGEALEFQNALINPFRNMIVFCVMKNATKPMILYVEDITSSLLKNVTATTVVLGVTGTVSLYVPTQEAQSYY